jgi:multidrug efflux pump subunit AcrB
VPIRPPSIRTPTGAIARPRCASCPQDKARIIGLSSAQIARSIGGAVTGATIGTYRERDELIEVVLRAPDAGRLSLGNIGNLQIQTSLGKSVPLSQIDTIHEVMEEPFIWRRSRDLALTVRADLVEGVQAPDIAMAIDPRLPWCRCRVMCCGGRWPLRSWVA